MLRRRREGGRGRREREKHYKQIILISACVCALRVSFSDRRSIFTTNLLHWVIDVSALGIFTTLTGINLCCDFPHSISSKRLNLLKLEANKQCRGHADFILGL